MAYWLLALPEETTRENNGLSVVGVLLPYLESLENQPDGQPLCERLVRILTAVSQYAGRFLGEDPAAAEGCSLGREPCTSDCEQLEAKAVRLMQRALQTWKNSEPTSRQTYVRDLELELEELADRILCHRCPVVAAMPRRWHARVLCCLDVMDLTHSLVQPSQQCLQIHHES